MTKIRVPALNQFVGSGRLAGDPSYKCVGAKQTPRLFFTVAINESFRKADGSYGDRVAFIPVTVWADQAKRLSAQLAKGDPVLVQGRIETNRNGTKYYTGVAARSVTLLETPLTESEASAEGLGGDALVEVVNGQDTSFDPTSLS